MNNRPIGILDSGLGGLTIWKEIINNLPKESTIYIGDSLNTPYGKKSPNEIYSLSKKLINFLLKKNVKAIVVACNAITVSCIDQLRSDFPQIPIIGTVPVVKTAVEVTKNKKIGILSTTTTAKSDYQKKLIKKFASNCKVFVHGTDDLVPLIEKGEFGGEKLKKILQKILSTFQKEQVDTLALACTHFPFIRREIENILGKKVILLDSGTAIGRQVKRILENNNTLSEKKKPKYEFFTTGNDQVFTKVAKTLREGTITESIRKIKL